ncbi:MAG: 50S ribosomal protein L18, partial [Candidatus Eremiobacteraeota bacterium]|nr:50S ribosomal protein L18 [Candidatus Eremiobacteraeota bacterium]
MTTMTSRNKLRLRRHERVRRRMVGSPGRPRLSVFRSLHHIYAQLIDDATGS